MGILAHIVHMERVGHGRLVRRHVVIGKSNAGDLMICSAGMMFRVRKQRGEQREHEHNRQTLGSGKPS